MILIIVEICILMVIIIFGVLLWILIIDGIIVIFLFVVLSWVVIRMIIILICFNYLIDICFFIFLF